MTGYHHDLSIYTMLPSPIGGTPGRLGSGGGINADGLLPETGLFLFRAPVLGIFPTQRPVLSRSEAVVGAGTLHG